jgi:hypothetical protein
MLLPMSCHWNWRATDMADKSENQNQTVLWVIAACLICIVGFFAWEKLGENGNQANSRVNELPSTSSRIQSSGGSGRTWRDDPATARQKAYADDLGIRYADDSTKGELSNLIDRAVNGISVTLPSAPSTSASGRAARCARAGA